MRLGITERRHPQREAPMSIFTLTTSQPRNSAEYDAEVIAAATGWVAFQQRGRGQRVKVSADTRDEARTAGQKLFAEVARPVLIYAVTPQGRQAHAETVGG